MTYPESTVYTVPNGADCEGVKRLLTGQCAAFTAKNVRGAPVAPDDMQRQPDVRTAPVTLIGDQVFYGLFNAPWLQMLAAFRRS